MSDCPHTGERVGAGDVVCRLRFADQDPPAEYPVTCRNRWASGGWPCCWRFQRARAEAAEADNERLAVGVARNMDRADNWRGLAKELVEALRCWDCSYPEMCVDCPYGEQKEECAKWLALRNYDAAVKGAADDGTGHDPARRVCPRMRHVRRRPKEAC